MNTPQSKSPIPNITNKLINPSSSSSNSPAINDSPIFNYISNLSPIQPVKAEPGAQGFPGLASPPLLFTSPRINSLQSLLNRKLQSSGSWESPLDKDKHHQTGGDPEKPARIDPEYNIPFLSGEQRPCSVKNLGQISHCSPGCIDDFLSDPDANSSCKRQSDDVSQSTGGGSLQIRDGRSCENLNLRGSTPLRVRKGGHAKSRISIKVVKNEARHLMPSSEGSGSVPRLLTEHAFEICQNGDSLNEASHIERGTLRRCLFEENQRKCSNRSEFRNFSDNLNRMEELTKLSSVGVLGAPPDSGTINNPKPPTGSCASPVTGSYPSISKPLGIGLHLNSVVYPRTLDSSSGSQQSSLAGFEGKNPVLTSNRSEGGVTVTILGNASEVGQQDKAYHTASLGEAKPSDIEHFYGPDLLKLDAHSASMCVKRKFSPQTAEYSEMPNQMSPKKKRKKSSNSDNDIPKRCNCKKTKCLKLYCDCFAAGMYCSESCACQGCCNRPENEGTVHETRQQIESRNPLAFAPKVVKLVTDPPAINKEVQNLSTPSSARHKTGCNCKKSMCLKKYCECYQANVGCSEGCRCEGCKNVFGVREDYRIIRAGSMVRNAADEISEAKADRKHTSPNLTPATPALPCSDIRKNAIKSRLPYMRFLPSPDSPNDVSISDENFLTCPENTQGYTMFLENGSECIDEVAYHADDLEDRLETTADMSITTSALRSDSVSTLMGPPSSSKTMSSSLRWRSSPITPINLSAGVEFQDPSSGGKNPDMIDDETPDVLRDSPTTNKSVKVSSPNKKRISAPQNPIDSSLQNLADSSGSLKVCHRFVLRALPTFPSLTPVSKKQP